MAGILKGKDDMTSVGNHRMILECMFSSDCGLIWLRTRTGGVLH